MFSVALDTCVLYPAYLRDTLLRIAAAGLYRPLWSEHILDELRRALPGPVTEEQRDRLIAQLRRMFPDALVHGYEPLIDTMTNHEKDRHVLAAAVRAAAAAVVTFNLDDFPDVAVDPFDIETLHPDEFLLNQLDLAPGATLDVPEQQVAGYRRPSMTVYDLASALERADCLQFADQLRLHLDDVTGPA